MNTKTVMVTVEQKHWDEAVFRKKNKRSGELPIICRCVLAVALRDAGVAVVGNDLGRASSKREAYVSGHPHRIVVISALEEMYIELPAIARYLAEEFDTNGELDRDELPYMFSVELPEDVLI